MSCCDEGASGTDTADTAAEAAFAEATAGKRGCCLPVVAAGPGDLAPTLEEAGTTDFLAADAATARVGIDAIAALDDAAAEGAFAAADAAAVAALDAASGFAATLALADDAAVLEAAAGFDAAAAFMESDTKLVCKENLGGYLIQYSIERCGCKKRQSQPAPEDGGLPPDTTRIFDE